MKVVVQRSKKSSVSVDGKLVNSIESGLCLLVGVHVDDTFEDADKLVNKVLNLRIFDDEEGIMNKSILDVGGEILSISQFTLQADTRKGHRPSYINAMKGEEAIVLYNKFNELLKDNDIHVETGIFGAEMDVHIRNDGPVTIIIDSKVR